jgi:hypothetical protein
MDGDTPNTTGASPGASGGASAVTNTQVSLEGADCPAGPGRATMLGWTNWPGFSSGPKKGRNRLTAVNV